MYVSQVDNSAYPDMVVYASICDDLGNQISDYAADLFSITELDSSGSEYVAEISEIAPLALGDAMSINLVLDQSGSMSDLGKMPSAKNAAKTFVGEIASTEGAEAEITSFENNVYNRQPFTSDVGLLNSAVSSLFPNGQTSLYDALYWAIQRTNLRSGSRVVIAFTDGEENSSNYSRNEVVDLSKMTGIPVYIIGVGDYIDEGDLRSLASGCGGGYYSADAVNLDSILKDIYEEIYDEQRGMFKISFRSTCPAPESEYRTIRLSASEGSGNEGSAEKDYIPVDNAPAFDNRGNSNAYILPDSSTRYYTRAELENLSLWELYLARNEIYARYGRGFNNLDLVEYFATRSWYTERYTPDEFNNSGITLNDCEQHNAVTMREIELEQNSPYITQNRS